MRILVTGGMGEIGRPTVQWLLDHGHDVRVIDLEIDDPIPGAECREGDVTDFDSLGDHMARMEGVVHLAAYRHPSMAPSPRLFEVNVGGTFNVFRAAADEGIRRVVAASSINALGYNFGITFPEGQLQYFPIDEAHPTYTTDPYSFSKQMIEEIGGYFWRREGVSSLFLRFPAVYDPDADPDNILLAFIRGFRDQTIAVVNLPEPERTRRIREIIERFQQKAAEGEWEVKFDLSFPDAYVMFARSNFWTGLDVRDAAQAIEKGLTANYEGSHAVYVTNERNLAGVPSGQLAELFFPEVEGRKRPLRGQTSLVSIDKARELIGFEPAFPFRPALARS